MLWGDSYRGNKLKKGTGDKEEEYMGGVQGITIMLMTCKRKTFACGVKERRKKRRAHEESTEEKTGENNDVTR